MKRRFWLISEAEVRLIERSSRSSDDDHPYGDVSKGGGRAGARSASDYKRLAKYRQDRTPEQKLADQKAMHARLNTPPAGVGELQKGDRVEITLDKPWGKTREFTYRTTFYRNSNSEKAIYLKDSGEPKRRLAWVYVKGIRKVKSEPIPYDDEYQAIKARRKAKAEAKRLAAEV